MLLRCTMPDGRVLRLAMAMMLTTTWPRETVLVAAPAGNLIGQRC
jgi:hypothetical protein